jgi:hypothetical protein
MEKNKNKNKDDDFYKKLKETYSLLENVFPVARIYDTYITTVPQKDVPSGYMRYGYTDPVNRKIYVDKRAKDTLIDTLIHELIHAQNLEVFKDDSDNKKNDPYGTHNERYDLEVEKIKKRLPTILKEIEKESNRKLTPYEILLMREQEKVLGPAPDLLKR